jgi:hypothetical protein
MMWAGNKVMKLKMMGWDAGLQSMIRVGVGGGNVLQQRTCEGRVWKKTGR